MRHLAALLWLYPLGPQPVLPAPLLEHRAQPDDVQERLLAHHPPDRRAVVVVEVAVDGDATGFSERDRLFDLAALEVAFAKRLAHDLRSGQIGRNAQMVHGRCACSGRRLKSPAAMRAAADSTRASTPASSRDTSIASPRRRSNRINRGSAAPGSRPRRAASAYSCSCTV